MSKANIAINRAVGSKLTKYMRYIVGHTDINEHGCWVWNGSVGTHGYGKASAYGATVFAHQLAFFIYHNIEMVCGNVICHKCDVKLCCNPDHLFVGTHMDNIMDAMSKGITLRNERVGTSKLTSKEVADIKRRLNNGAIGRRLAEEYGVCPSTISNIRHGAFWANIEPSAC